MKGFRTRTCLATAICLVLGLFAAVPAQASFHLNRIREIHVGSGTGDYVELQMPAAGENLVAGQHIVTYSNSGIPLSDVTLPANVANSQSQAMILIADSPTVNGVTADFSNSMLNVASGGGAVCYGTFDCVGYGMIGPIATSSPYGTPAVQGTGLSPGQTLTRSIAGGCPTLFELSDDTNNSAADFSLSSPNPRNNSSPITEKACAPGVGVGGDPNTKIKKRPKNRSGDDSPTFKFKSDEVGSTFKCKLDHKKFHKCKSPKTYHGVAPGKHSFKVEAIDADGNVDPTPAKDKFKILP
jgi:hypothetical protein